MEITQHARYTCTFCGKVRMVAPCVRDALLILKRATGFPEASGSRHLEMRVVQESDSGWRLDRIDNSSCYYSQVRCTPALSMIVS